MQTGLNNILIHPYGFLVAGAVCGAGVTGFGTCGPNVPGAAMLDGFEAACAAFTWSELSDLVAPPFTATLIANDNTIRPIAKIQVPFSKKSPVFCTPINWDELEKFDDKPPPLGFCINTIKPKNRQTKIVMMINNMYISFLYYYFFCKASIWVAK